MSQQSGTLELDEVLQKIVFYCIDEARNTLVDGEELIPFTVVVEGDQMFVENYPAEDVVTCRANAQANVKSASTFSTYYAFCYDGFLMTDQGQVDSIIVECAQRDMKQAYAIGLLYRIEDDGVYTFDEGPAFLQNVDSFYDREAVEHAEAEEKEAADSEMEKAQEALDKTVGAGNTPSSVVASGAPEASAEDGAAE